MRWVVLLLAIAVVLPTACLLWFMSEAVKNERLAMRQKLADSYDTPLEQYAESVEKMLESKLKRADLLAIRAPGYVFQELVERVNINTLKRYGFDGALFYDPNGILVYPTFSQSSGEAEELPDELERARELEFVEGKPAEAIEEYRNIDMARRASDLRSLTGLHRLLGEARCLLKLRDIKGAADAYDRARSWIRRNRQGGGRTPEVEKMKDDLPRLELHASLMHLKLSEYSDQDMRVGMSKAMDRMGKFKHIPSDLRVFYASGVLEVFKGQKNHDKQMTSRGLRLAKLVEAESLSMDAAEDYPSVSAVEHLPLGRWSLLLTHYDVYAARYEIEGYTLLLLLKTDTVVEYLSRCLEMLDRRGLAYRIVDDLGRHVCGIYQPKTKPFVTGPMGGHLAKWQIEVYLDDPAVYENAVKRQIAIYIWAGVLVIVMILAAGGFAGRAVGRQMKLNRLKNDFIATVSHELKTPLASMRVLADTLLEGNYNDQKQATEYLELICKENKRLSGLIDNFLTFSRMERNKQAFDMERTSPGEIARGAADAVKTKFEKGECELGLDVGGDLPDVVADADAMVTVVVNLLDNAYKYSDEDKKIALNVFAENGWVSFSVRDNGIGMSRGATRKVFKRFYQVDRSLSRRAEGCGLGLSIAKFIVDAHKGEILVESRPGEGSTFTVKLPAVG